MLKMPGKRTKLPQLSRPHSFSVPQRAHALEIEYLHLRGLRQYILERGEWILTSSGHEELAAGEVRVRCVSSTFGTVQVLTGPHDHVGPDASISGGLTMRTDGGSMKRFASTRLLKKNRHLTTD